MRLAFERRRRALDLMALGLAALAIAFDAANRCAAVLAARQPPVDGAENLFPRSADRPMGVAGDRP